VVAINALFKRVGTNPPEFRPGGSSTPSEAREHQKRICNVRFGPALMTL